MLTFDLMGDIDDLQNLNVLKINDSAVILNWTQIKAVDGYIIKQIMPLFYPEPEPIKTKNYNLTCMLPDNNNNLLKTKCLISDLIFCHFSGES